MEKLLESKRYLLFFYVYSLNTDILVFKATILRGKNYELICIGNKRVQSLLPIFFSVSKRQPFYHLQPICQVQNLEAPPHNRHGSLGKQEQAQIIKTQIYQ